MTDQQKAFADYYLMNGNNATQAAKDAGYSAKTAYSQGQRLLKNVEIMEYIRAQQKKAASDRAADADAVRAFWSQTMTDEAERINNRLKASELLAKSYGMFTQQITIEEKKAEPENNVIILPKEEYDRYQDGDPLPGVPDDYEGAIVLLPEVGRIEDYEVHDSDDEQGTG